MQKIDTPDSITPFLRWAGGKRWLTKRLIDLTPEFTGTYFEPFLGSAAIFFSRQPKHAVLSDKNQALIETYQAIKSDFSKVEKHLRVHAANHSTEHYYAVRAANYRTPHTRAAQFIYLNRTCWNGLYRVNKQGVFNVPIGTKQTVIYENESFQAVSELLKNSDILYSDFETQINKAKTGDHIFADPPYTVRHKHNGFITYNEVLFSWDDQVRLRDALLRAKNRQVKVFLTNADHKSIRELYETDFELTELSRYSAIAGIVKNRGSYPELLIT